ncbi:type II toxin-antitoxin system PemK/MazF family toxin [soil metagenome]
MIKRGEIYFVDLTPTVGREQTGKRPVLVISSNSINRLPLVVSVVAGTKGENITADYPTNVRILPQESGLSIETVFMCFQIRALDQTRFPERAAGRVSVEIMEKIEDSIRYCLEL